MSELTEILKETVNRLFGNLVTRDVLEKAEAGEWPTNLWTALVENGLTHPLVPENKGGVGATFEDIYEIIYAAGYHGAPVPLAETILASWLTAASGLDVPGGPDSPGAPMAILEYRDDAPLKLASTGAGWCLNGTAPNTPWGHMADTLVAVADAGGALRVALLVLAISTWPVNPAIASLLRMPKSRQSASLWDTNSPATLSGFTVLSFDLPKWPVPPKECWIFRWSMLWSARRSGAQFPNFKRSSTN